MATKSASVRIPTRRPSSTTGRQPVFRPPKLERVQDFALRVPAIAECACQSSAKKVGLAHESDNVYCVSGRSWRFFIMAPP